MGDLRKVNEFREWRKGTLVLRTLIEKNVGAKQLTILWMDLAREISHEFGI